MNTAANIAKYVILYCYEKKRPITNFLLQMMLYCIQGNSLLKKQEVMFQEHIYAWLYGPVVPYIYNIYMGCGIQNLPKPNKYKELAPVDKEIINATIDAISINNDGILEGAKNIPKEPWEHHKDKGEIIPVVEIKEYFVRYAKHIKS